MVDRVAKDALFDGFAAVAKALSAGRRAELIDVLAQGERTVEGLAAEIGQSVANTSQHLQVLARAGLVSSRRDATRIHYKLASDTVGELWAAVRGVAVERLAGFDDLVEAYVGDRSQLEPVERGELKRRFARSGNGGARRATRGGIQQWAHHGSTVGALQRATPEVARRTEGP